MNQSGPTLTAFELLSDFQQMKVLEFTSVTNMQDLEKATQFIRCFNFDVNMAAQAFFEGKDPTPVQNNLSSSRTQSHRAEAHIRIPIEESKGDSNHVRELKDAFKKHFEKKKKEEHDNSGLIGRSKKITKSIGSGLRSIVNALPIAIRGENPGGERFVRYFSKKHPKYAAKLDFKMGTLSEITRSAHRGKKPSLLYAHLEGKWFSNTPNVIFESEQLIAYIKKHFLVLGLLVNSDTPEELTKHLGTKDFPCLAVFRLNIVDEVSLVQHITIANNGDPLLILETLRGALETFRAVINEEELIKRDVRAQYNRERQGSRASRPIQFQAEEDFYVPPRQTTNTHLDEARILREQQEEDFRRVEEQIRMQQELERENKRREDEEREIKRKEEASKRSQEQETKRAKELYKQQCRDALPPELSEDDPNAILILFRLPIGERISRRFSTSDKVSLLYKFIDSLDIKFEESEAYDLIQPMPFLCLEEHEKRISDYFEGSQQETLVIREKI